MRLDGRGRPQKISTEKRFFPPKDRENDDPEKIANDVPEKIAQAELASTRIQESSELMFLHDLLVALAACVV